MSFSKDVLELIYISIKFAGSRQNLPVPATALILFPPAILNFPKSKTSPRCEWGWKAMSIGRSIGKVRRGWDLQPGHGVMAGVRTGGAAAARGKRSQRLENRAGPAKRVHGAWHKLREGSSKPLARQRI